MFSYDECSKMPEESVSSLQGYPVMLPSAKRDQNNDAQQSSKGVEAGWPYPLTTGERGPFWSYETGGLLFDNSVNAPKSALAMMTDRVKDPKSSRVGQAACRRLVPPGLGVIHFCA